MSLIGKRLQHSMTKNTLESQVHFCSGSYIGKAYMVTGVPYTLQFYINMRLNEGTEWMMA